MINHPFFLAMQIDNNLVIYDSTNGVFWATMTEGKGNQNYLQMRDDGNLAIERNNGTVIWQTNIIIGNNWGKKFVIDHLRSSYRFLASLAISNKYSFKCELKQIPSIFYPND